jgi:orotate phosphoribosyltransferase
MSEWAERGGAKSMQDELVSLLAARRGHFRLESGHHGDLWLDLDALFLRPDRLCRFAVEIARRLAHHTLGGVCGPLLGGAFLAQMVASELSAEFYYAERFVCPPNDASGAVEYRIPNPLREKVRDKAIAIVDDVINSGSALRATFTDLQACGARPVAIGALLVLGSSAFRFATDKGLALESIAQLPNVLWEPSQCPLCSTGVPLEDPGAAPQ